MTKRNKIVGSLALSAILALGVTGCGSSSDDATPTTKSTAITTAQKNAVLHTYADIALDNYTQAYTDAKALQTALKTFTDNPDDTNLAAAKTAWKTARESYLTTEAFRLSNGPIDGEGSFSGKWNAPEGELNDWPLDENLIDYTQAANGTITSGNIIDTEGNFTPAGSNEPPVDVSTITKEALAALNEDGGDANVATGYHSIEFLLWGQDQDYADFLADNVTHGATVAGERPLTDYTTDQYKERRKAYLNAAADLIVDDLKNMVDAWTPGAASYRDALLNTDANNTNNIPTNTALKQIFSGLGTFSKSELANERIAVAVLTPSEEDEHSCFSDNTHRDITQDYQGIKNIIKGQYKGASEGTSIYSLLSDAEKEKIDTYFTEIDAKIKKMDDAVKEYHFDYQIKPDNVNRQNLIDLKNQLRHLGDEMVKISDEFGISLTSDDVTDSEETQI